MAIFRYKLIDRDGAIQRGVSQFAFNSQSAAVAYFERRGNVVVSVSRLPALLESVYEAFFRQLSRRIKNDDVSEFLRSIAVMLKAGVPLIEAIEDATEHLNNPALSRVAEEIRLSIESGISLSDTVDKYRTLFPPAVVYLVRMGEETGLLDRTLMDAAEHLRRVSRIAVDVKKALIYPSFALAATLFAVVFWLEFTVPSLQELYRQMQVTLPAATEAVIELSESIQQHFLLYLLTPVVLVLLFRLLIRRNAQARYRFHQLLMRLPVIRRLIEYSNMAFIFEYFTLLLHSGVDIYRTLGVISQSLNNEVYREAIGRLRHEVSRGEGVTSAIMKQKLFPRFVGRMVKTGESSGSLDEQMQFIASEYRAKLTDIIDRLKTLVEPLSVVLIGGLMLVIIGALFFPIYQLIGNIGSAGL